MSPSLIIQKEDTVAVSASDNDVVSVHWAAAPVTHSSSSKLLLSNDKACVGPHGLCHLDHNHHHHHYSTQQSCVCKAQGDNVEPPAVCSDSRSFFLQSGAMTNGGASGNDDDRDGPNIGEESTGGSEDRNVPSNEFLLLIAFFSFLIFALMQLVFSFVAGSQAMMGDSIAMIVDSLTYLFNWIAERWKRRFDEDNKVVLRPPTTLTDGQTTAESTALDRTGESGASNVVLMEAQIAQRYILQRTKRKMVLHLEVIPPMISVTTLAAVTIVVINRAVRVLLFDLHRNTTTDQQGQPNVTLMLAFSIVNLFLDGVNVCCFARAKHLMGYSVIEKADTDERLPVDAECDTKARGTSQKSAPSKNAKCEPHSAKHCPLGSSSGEKGGLCNDVRNVNDTVRPLQPIEGESLGEEYDSTGMDDAIRRMHTTSRCCDLDDGDLYNRTRKARSSSGRRSHEHTNLNMCSAYTHVIADTLRSIAVIIAAVIAKLVPAFTPILADASAAVVVSFLIVLSLIPLVQGLVRRILELRAIYAEERSDLFKRTETVRLS
jgi:Co/Zn/Cd efflux system component